MKIELVEQCDYEQWDEDTCKMGHCKEPARYRLGAAKLCEFHAKHCAGIRGCDEKDGPELFELGVK